MSDKQSRDRRLAQIQTVLFRTMILNLTVCTIKIVLGLTTGIVTIAADGFHSLGDSLSNVVGLFSVRLARHEPDERYPYGYEKFESIGTMIIAMVVAVTFFEVVKGGIYRLLNPEPVSVSWVALALLAGTIVINLIIVRYEGDAGRRLNSELLIADSNETKSDIFVALGVMVSVLFISRWNRLDGAVALIIALAILRIIVEIVTSTARVLADAQVVPPEQVKAIVMAVTDVKFCHAIRSRGRQEGFYLDLHLGVEPEASIEFAHDVVCHRVKLALHDAFPNLKSANVHIEPDNHDGRKRGHSVFRNRDPYGHSR